MKISFFIGSLGKGGAERVICKLANDFARLNWDVDIVLLLKNQVDYPLSDGINLVDLTCGAGSYLKNAAPWLLRIRKYLNNRAPDRVVSFVGRINALVLTAALGLKISVLVSERNDPRRDGRGKFMQVYCGLIYRKADRIVFQTQYQRKCFPGIPDEKCVIVPNPVKANALRAAVRKGRLVSVGRLAPQKNHKMLVDALEILTQKGIPVFCDIYGDGPQRAELQSYIQEKNLDGVISLKGNSDDVHAEIADASAFIMTSDFEGLSNAMIEAMMIGIPCVSTDYDGSEELISDKENGLIVPRNDPRALAEAVEGLLSDPDMAGRLSENAKASAEHFGEEIVLKQWENAIIRSGAGK